jgi:hypothetical protein
MFSCITGHNQPTKYDAKWIFDLLNNPVGYLTSLAKCSAFCCFYAEVIQKLEVSEQLDCFFIFA